MFEYLKIKHPLNYLILQINNFLINTDNKNNKTF